MVNEIPPIIEVGGILISSDIITEYFCCDYEKCKGICCVEGDAGAPVTMDEIALGIGKRTGVLAMTDAGFAKSCVKGLDEIAIDREEFDL